MFKTYFDFKLLSKIQGKNPMHEEAVLRSTSPPLSLPACGPMTSSGGDMSSNGGTPLLSAFIQARKDSTKPYMPHFPYNKNMRFQPWCSPD